MDSENQSKSVKLPKSRSPNYPANGLKEAIDEAARMFQGISRHAVGIDVALGHIGYKFTSSSGKLHLAALRAYGLIEYVDGGKDRLVKLTPRALDIVADYSGDHPKRLTAIREAALAPKIHTELWEKWGVILPPDEEIRRYLVRERGFYDKSVNDFIAQYRGTLAYAGFGQSGTIRPADDTGEGEEDEGEDEQDQEDQSPARQRRRRPMQAGMKEDTYTLDDGQVVIQWPERIGAEEIEDVESWMGIVIRKMKRAAQKVDESEDD